MALRFRELLRLDLSAIDLRKGVMVLMMPHLKDHDPDYYDAPETFDVGRTFDPDVMFGYGPRYCIGAALAKAKAGENLSTLPGGCDWDALEMIAKADADTKPRFEAARAEIQADHDRRAMKLKNANEQAARA